MATTTNYGWTTPDDTALVKDGASAIRSLGTSVDTTTKNLNPSTTLGDIEYRSSTANTNTRLGIGTTGQVLTVAGGVPTWATSDDANAIQNALLTTTGDTIYASGASTPARLGIGSTGQVLTVAAGVPSWAALPSSTPTFVGCQVYLFGTPPNLSAGTLTLIGWDAEVFDTDGFHDNATNNSRMTIPSGKAGYYQVSSSIRFDGNSGSTQNRVLNIEKNNAILTGFYQTRTASVTSATTTINASVIVYLNVADYIHIKAQQFGSTAIDLIADGCNFSISYLGA
jgi:hypothetical protein